MFNNGDGINIDHTYSPERRLAEGTVTYSAFEAVENWCKLSRAHTALKELNTPLPPHIKAIQSRDFYNCYHITFVEPNMNHYCWLFLGNGYPYEPPELYTCYLFNVPLPCRNNIDQEGRIGKNVIGTWHPNMTIIDFLAGMRELLINRNAAVDLM